MKILSKNQLDSLQADLVELLAKYGLTAGYMVAEIRPNNQPKGDYVAVVVAHQKGHSLGPLLDAIGSQTYSIISANAPKAPHLTDN